jgi:exodeoxyribonuclease VII large subunit
LTRGDQPDSDGLWDDLPEEPRAGRRTAEAKGPPDWALPSWDSVPEPGVDAEVRRPSRPVPATAPAPVRATEPAEAPVGGEPTFDLRILGVSEVTRVIRDAVRSDPELRDVWVEGEVGRVTISSAGHCYFALKDEKSQLACVFFRDNRLASPFEARTGLRVVVHGRIDLFEAQGVYQLYVSSIQPAGFGDLALRFEALKARLAAEGLFDTSRKRALPARPAVVGVVTSPTGAVWHDIQQVVGRRWPLATLLLSPCRVQGDGSASSVVAGLDRLARWGEWLRSRGRGDEAPAVVILARGGGSLEDLWSFNDERVVRAVVAHPVPVVCGVGHEVDVTLADFAADVRAPTPSAAAELVVPDRVEVAAGVTALERRARATVLACLERAGRELAAEGRALDRLKPGAQLAQARERAGVLLDRATRVIRDELSGHRRAEAAVAGLLAPLAAADLAARRASVDRLGAALSALGPQATLDRGYAIVRRQPDGSVVRDPSDAPGGSAIRIRVAKGEIDAHVDAGSAPASGSGREGAGR